MTIVLLAASAVLNSLSAMAIGYSNADRFHAGIWRSLPWTRGNVLSGDLWSVPAFLAVMSIATIAAASGYGALRGGATARRRDAALALLWLGVLQAGYWLLAGLSNFAATAATLGAVPPLAALFSRDLRGAF